MTELAMDTFLFVTYVINCSDQDKHKPEKIKITVKSAEKVLKMEDLKKKKDG